MVKIEWNHWRIAVSRVRANFRARRERFVQCILLALDTTDSTIIAKLLIARTFSLHVHLFILYRMRWVNEVCGRKTFQLKSFCQSNLIVICREKTTDIGTSSKLAFCFRIPCISRTFWIHYRWRRRCKNTHIYSSAQRTEPTKKPPSFRFSFALNLENANNSPG